MGRARKGRDISGWLVVDKPAGLTSTAVVNKVRWALSAKKAGHAGTLDPEATGVLAVALGEATKTVPYITDALKAYRFTVRLGQATNTDDAEGEVIQTSDLRPADDEIKEALHGFVGEIMQVPPQLIMVGREDADHVTLEMVCGKGGYVRSIARDLGEKLGCFGHVRELRRIWSGPFEAEDALSLDEIERLAKDPALDAHLLPLEAGLSGLPEVRCTAQEAAKIRNGNPGLVFADGLDYGDMCWASCDGAAVAVGRFRGGAFHPDRVFVAHP